MGVRGDLLELIDDAPGSLRTLEGRLWEWRHLERSRAALQRLAPRAAFASFGAPGTEAAETLETISRVSLVMPDRWRIEGDGQLDVSEGTRRWSGTKELLTEHDLEAPDLDNTQLGRFVAPGFLLGIVRFGEPTEDVVAGRRCWRTEATVDADRRFPGPPVMALQFGGVDHTFWFDAGTGIVLRHAGTVDGRPCVTSEFWEVELDGEVPTGRFRPEPGPETTLRRTSDLQLRMAEARGVDLSEVDRSDPSAVRAAIGAAIGSPGLQGPRSMAGPTSRRAAHRPTGPTPTDEPAARAAVVEAFTRLGQIGDDGTSLPHVHHGAGLAAPMDQARQRLPNPDRAAFGVIVDDVLFLRPDEAVVWFTITVDGNRFAMVDGREGRAVLVDGTWLVEHATFAGLMAFAMVPMPPVDDSDADRGS